jgi:phycobilisome core component
LGVPIAPTVLGIQIMKDVVKAQVAEAGIENPSFVEQPFDYITRELSERDI